MVLLIVSAVLYLYRRIYAEVCSALPLNGGPYTVLLNTTNKKFAASAACLTLLSCVATACISANEAMQYARDLFGGLNVIWATVGVSRSRPWCCRRRMPSPRIPPSSGCMGRCQVQSAWSAQCSPGSHQQAHGSMPS